ncbi:RNA-binding domain-containing protein [Solitalea koreensis]|uniref:DNA-binding domain-containing protein n=1 Tax=Solitalea koreensis TaxID=543615 RepID=A0A521BE33_9SPHI|nr:ATP-binding protein [Solitalea koreensis]SMO45319.1 Putative DNA-binding domain-containing protein [Solitalea koreensis]
MNLRKLILAGESVTLDFKKTITSCEKIAKTMVSFANNRGGRLLIGVADDGIIKGVKSEDEEKYMILQAAHFYCRPQLEPYFDEITVDDKIVVVVEIKESDSKPHYALGEDKKWWVYIRVKDHSVLASKVVVDVLRKETKGDNIFLEYSSKEKALLEYLNTNDRITLPEFTHLLNISKRAASRILVNLVLMGVIRVHTTEKTEFYTAS